MIKPEHGVVEEKFHKGIGVMKLTDHGSWEITNEGCYRCKRYFKTEKVGLTVIEEIKENSITHKTEKARVWVCEDCITNKERIIRRDHGSFRDVGVNQFADMISDKTEETDEDESR